MSPKTYENEIGETMTCKYQYILTYGVCWNCGHEYCLKNEVKKDD